MSFQDTLLLSTCNNQAAVVPDIFSSQFTLARKRSLVEETFLDTLLLYDQSPVKKHCPSPLNTPLQFDFTFGTMQKQLPSYSFANPNNSIPNQPRRITNELHFAISEQPEQFYRARYDSEGVRAPLKGINDNYPSVELSGHGIKQAVVTVKLVHDDEKPHTCCSLDSSDDRKKALTKRVTPVNSIVRAEFEDLRIRREKKKEGRKSAASAERARDGKYDKVAYLLFTAEIMTECGQFTKTVMSSPISLTAAPEPAELDWLVPTRGHFGGKEVVAIKGSKMTSPKVIFRIRGVAGDVIELPGTVDKEKSHQNVLLVRTPIIDHISFGLGHQVIKADVIVITGRNQMCSNSLNFEFIPNDICRECMQETAPLKPLTHQSSTLNVGMPPCSPIRSPGIQPSPVPVYSYVPSPGPTSPYEDIISVPGIHGSMPAPPVTRKAVIQPGITLGEAYDNKDKDIMQIVQHLMSPAGSPNSESAPLPSYPDVIYCGTPGSPELQAPDTIVRIEEMLLSLQSEGQITTSGYLFYLGECRMYNVDLLKAFSESNGDKLTFLRKLASLKPSVSQTHQ